MKRPQHPVVYFEIPVTNMERAVQFYTAVFEFTFERTYIDNNEMALFPLNDTHPGITGGLAKGEIYQPTHNGTLIYFHSDNISQTLERAVTAGGKVLYPKTSNGDLGYVAEFEDSEGNRIALHEEVC
ncbi:VOC family protein [Chitinophaga pendula]|uniref:VOC family protein n=1 Tax=Chitinophaga TaxID=79328 RepID=UPI000BAF39F5|nr:MULTISPECIES: VOC family protein [Chitinophaga]ASZ10209.1 glyoxalase [Chitinophaga sp. MD30]UCJ06831.1 VOC family protein [Chitinophaga pendula]